MTRENIEFDANGTMLRGWLYRDNQSLTRQPLIVMAHGFTAIKEMSLDKYAEVFSAAGMAVLVFDHRNTGESDGSPRFEIDPVAQWRDYSHAITFGQTLSGIDPGQIGIWGSSLSGGEVIAVAAIDRRARCVVAQVPMISGNDSIRRQAPASAIKGMIEMVNTDRAAQFAGKAPGLVQVTAADPAERHIFPGQRSYDYFHNFKKRLPSLAWENMVTVSTIRNLFEMDVTSYVERVSPIPMLMIIAEEDISSPTDTALQAYRQALEPKRLLLVPGDHFGSYVEEFERTAPAARDWFCEHLIGTTSTE